MEMERFFKKNLKNIILIVIYIVMFFVVATILSKILYRYVITPENEITYSILMNVLIYGVLFISGILLLKKEIVTDFKILSKSNAFTIFKYCLITLGFAYLGNFVGSIISSWFDNGSSGTGSANQQVLEIMLFSDYGILTVIITMIVGPIVEELVFRKALHKTLKYFKLSPVLIVTVSAILFGLIHVISAGDIQNIFPYLFMGVALGTLEIKTDNIFPSIFVHIFINSAAVSLLYAMQIISDRLP